jgi:tetratricopeptide (TPR) repeat protein
MIVKNESRIIERLLESVAPIIDTFCICDTGSTDNTKELIFAFFDKRGIRGEIFEEPFKNFGYNRSIALKRANAWGDYVLLMDADMRLVIGPEFKKDMLTKDGYSVLQMNVSLDYYNTRFVKTNIGVTCVSPTHEYYIFPKGHNEYESRIPPHMLRIDDIGDGGSKSDKYDRDIRLLKEGLVEEPTNGRYHFYIANSLRDVGKHAEAIEWYTKRIALGGWEEEIWCSAYERGKAYFAIGDEAKGIESLLLAYQTRQHRAEPLYELAKYYRMKGHHATGMIFCKLGLSIPFPKDDILFIQRDIYDHQLEYEYTILAYYTKDPIDHMKYLKLLSSGYHRENVLCNYQYYVNSLHTMPNVLVSKKSFQENMELEVRGKMDFFRSSSPCILPLSEGYLMNIRYVNYKLNKENASYSYRWDDQKIITLNKAVYMDKDLRVLREQWIDKVHREDIRYLGIEDVKVFSHEGELRFMGTVQDDQGRPRIGEGLYDPKSAVLVPTVYPSPKDADCEKNWVYFHHKGALKVMYQWNPLTYGQLKDGAFVEEGRVEANLPAFLRDARGSTNGVLVEDELWFLCHYVGHTTPRQYYHFFLALDANSLAFKRHSTLFKFENEKLEYALGFVVEPTRILISYSKWDSDSILAVYNRKELCDSIRF